MNIRQSLVASGILCLAATTASAEWERTISAWDTRTPAQGKCQVSVWGNYMEWEEAPGVDGDQTGAQIYINYGIADNWNITVATSFLGWSVDPNDSESGLGDSLVATSYRFLNEADSGCDMAIVGSVQLPTGDDDKYLGTGHVEPGLAILASKTVGSIIVVFNCGMVVICDSNPGEEDYLLHAELEGVCPINDMVSANVAFSFETARWEDADDDYIDMCAGVRIHPTKQTFVAPAVYMSLNDAYDWGCQIGAGVEF